MARKEDIEKYEHHDSIFDNMSCGQIVQELTKHTDIHNIKVGDIVLVMPNMLLAESAFIRTAIVTKVTDKSIFIDDKSWLRYDKTGMQVRGKGFGNGNRIYDTFRLSIWDLILIKDTFRKFSKCMDNIWDNKCAYDMYNIAMYASLSRKHDSKISDLVHDLIHKKHNEKSLGTN